MSVLPSFPKISSLQPGQTYAEIIAKPRDTFNEKEGWFREQIKEIFQLIPKWKERHEKIEQGTVQPPLSNEELESEFKQKIQTYIRHRAKVRDEAKNLLHLFDQALTQCLPKPTGLWPFYQQSPLNVDTETLEFLLRLEEANIESIKRKYKAFCDGVTQLQEQKGKLAEIHASAERALTALKLSLEPLAAKYSNYQGLRLPRPVNEAVGRAAYVKYWVDQLSKNGDEQKSSDQYSLLFKDE